jgi:hypothetical protein
MLAVTITTASAQRHRKGTVRIMGTQLKGRHKILDELILSKGFEIKGRRCKKSTAKIYVLFFGTQKKVKCGESEKRTERTKC